MNSKLQKKVSGDIGNLANNCLGSGNFIANSTIYQHEIIVHVDENIVSPFNNSNGVTTPTKTILTEIEFDPFEQIYYYDSTVTVSTSSFVNANSLYYTMDSLDLRYSFNIESPLEANKNVYLKTNLQFSQKVKLDADTPVVQELEDATDEVWYILIGRAIDDYHISLYLDKKIFHSDGSEVVFHDHDDRYYTQPEVDSKVTPMYGYCETAAATVAKTVTINNFTLVTGRTIFVKFKYANTASNPTLNVNGTGAKRIYRWGTTSAGTTAATNGWQANSVIALTYDGTGWIEHLWQNNQYNMATNYLGTGGYTADSVVYRYKILVHLDKDTLSPLNNTDSIVSPTKTILTDIEFDPFSQIYYYDSTTVINAGDLIAGTAIAYTFNNIDLRQTFNIDDDNNPLTLNKDVYMKVIPLPNGKVKIASEMPLVQELPTINDGYWYIFLGRAATRTYGLSLYPEKPVFYHDGIGIRQKFNPYLDYAINENAIQGTISGNIVSFDDGIESPIIDLKVAIESVQEGTGNPSPENVRPITGWTGVNVIRTGKNLLPKLLSTEEIGETHYSLVSDGDSITLNNTVTDVDTAAIKRITDYFLIKAGTYILSGNNPVNFPAQGEAYIQIRFVNKATGTSPNEYRLTLSEINTSKIITFTSDTYISLNVRVYKDMVLDNFVITPSLYLVSEANTTFESSQRTEYPISWESEAGTVYGGSLDVTTGLLTVDWRSVTLTGAEEEGWSIKNSGTANWYYITKNDILINSISNSESLISNLYPWVSILNANTNKGIWNSTSSNHIRVRWGTEDTIANWKSFLASNPLHVVYKTLEPLTYQLTPTEVTTLLGSNRIWVDTGNVDVTYIRNTNNGKIITNINNNIKSILNWFGLTYYNNGIYVNSDQGV